MKNFECTGFFFVGLIFSLFPVCRCFLFGCSCGTLEPQNPYIFVNETLRMNCTLDESMLADGVTANDLEIVFGNDIVVNNVVVASNRTLLLEKTLTTTDGESMYLCVIRGRPYQQGIVGSQYVKVDISPQNISDFSCVVYDWDSWMNCSWTLPKYKHLQLVNLTLLASNDGGSSFHECPYIGGNKTFCVWNHKLTPNDFYPVDVLVWYFSFTVQNTHRNVSVTSTFTIRPDENVKPAPVDHISVTETSSSCLSLQWTIRKYRSQVFRITLTTKDAKSKVKETDVNAKGITVCGLTPLTEYTVSVIRKPPESGYWSEPTEITTKTTQVSDTRDEGHLDVIISIVAVVATVAIVVVVILSVICCRRKLKQKSHIETEIENQEMGKIIHQKSGTAEIPDSI